MDFFHSIGACFQGVVGTYGLIGSLFLAGLVGSISHCAIMCGPFIISQTGETTKLRDVALIPYHLGRMTTYVFMAILVYSLLSLVFVYSDIKAIIAAPMLFLAGVIFIVSAFPKLSVVFPWVAQINMSVPSRFISPFLGRLMKAPNAIRKYGLGLLLGFMPCGMVVAALIASASASSLPMAIAAMAAFSFGTMPALIVIGIGGQRIKNHFPNVFSRFSQITKLISALWLFALAGSLVL